MKKLVIYLFALFLIISCGNNIGNNSGYNNYELLSDLSGTGWKHNNGGTQLTFGEGTVHWSVHFGGTSAPPLSGYYNIPSIGKIIMTFDVYDYPLNGTYDEKKMQFDRSIGGKLYRKW